MRALIMGGTEFISLHLAQSLVARGHEVVVFNRGRRSERSPAGVRAIAGEDALLDRRHRQPITIVRPTHVMGPLNTRHNETSFMDRIWRGRPVLIPGHGGFMRQFGHVEDLAEMIAGLPGEESAYGQAYNVMGDDVVTQVGPVELIAEVIERPVTVRYVDPALVHSLGTPGPIFGQNLVYECHAVHTTSKLRRELGVRPRYTLASAIPQTWTWYRDSGLLDRPIDFTFEDQILAKIGG